MVQRGQREGVKGEAGGQEGRRTMEDGRWNMEKSEGGDGIAPFVKRIPRLRDASFPLSRAAFVLYSCPMQTTIELPDDLAREAEARAARDGRTLPDLVAEGLRALLRGKPDSTPTIPPRTGAGEWARKFLGVAAMDPGETTDDVRAAYYQKK